MSDKTHPDNESDPFARVSLTDGAAASFMDKIIEHPTKPHTMQQPMSQETVRHRQSPPQDEINLTRILYMVLGHWYLILLAITIAFAGAYLYLRYKLPVYRVSATVMIEDETYASYYGSESLLEGFGLQPVSNILDNQIQILSSYTLVSKALDELPFDINYFYKGRIRSSSTYPNDPITVIPDSGSMPLNTEFALEYLDNNSFKLSVEESDFAVVAYFGAKIPYKNSSFTVLPHPENWNDRLKGQKIHFVFEDREGLIASYQSRLNVETTSDYGTIVKLSLEGTNKEKDRDFLNKLIEKFLNSSLEKKNQEASRVIEFIDEQLIGISDSLMITENKLQDFRSRNRVMDISAQGTQIIEQAVKLEDEKARLILEANYYDYLTKYLAEGSTQETPVAPATMGITDPMLTRLVEELATLQTEYLSGPTSERNPIMVQLSVKIKNTQQSLRETLKNLIQANQIAQSENSEQIRTLNTEAAGLPVTEQQLLGFERKYKLNDELYTFLLEKRAEGQIQKASNTPDNELVDPARSEGQIAPKAQRVYLMALMLGLGVPVSLLLVADFFNNKVTSEDELRRITSLPVTGHIPHSDFEKQTVVLSEPGSGVAESFRSLRTRLQFFIRETRSPVILVTSSMPGEGKTFTAINLASAYSISGKKSVIVGFDLRKPKLYSDFNLSNESGVSTYLIGKHSLKEIIQTTEFPNLHLITAGPIPPNPAELASSEKTKELIRDLKKLYDYIIIDSAPIGTVSDSYAVAQMADATLLIVRHGKTIKNLLQSTLTEAKANEVKGLSVLINDMDMRSIAYRYSYYYGYGYKYEKEKSGKSL